MKFLCTLLLTSLAIASMAQNHQVKGILLDQNSNDPLIGASIVLTSSRDSTNQHLTVSDVEGRFSFNKIKNGVYELSVFYIGYNQFRRTVGVMNRTVHLGRIKLIEKAELLNEVTIEGKVPAATQKGDTLQFNADAYKTNPDANAEDLLEKMPGIMMQNGKVQAQGEDVRRVLVDGREFFGNDPNAVLKNIPADIIQKIEVFDQQSEQSLFTGFDDGSTSKTINIVTRPEARNGVFGRVNGGYGTEGRYSAGAVVNDFNEARRISVLGLSNNVNEQNFSSEDLAGVMSSSSGGRRGRGRGGRRGGQRGQRIGGSNANDFLVAQQNGITKTNSFGINYSDEWGEKVEVTGSYFFNRTANDVGKDLFRQYNPEADSGMTYRENEDAFGTNLNHRFNLRLDYQINERNSILYRPSLSVQQNEGSSFLTGETHRKGQQINGIDNLFMSDLSAMRLSNSLLFRHRFGKVGRTISLNVSQQYNSTIGNSNLESINLEKIGVQDSLDQISAMDQYKNTLSANIVFTERLGEGIMLTFNHRTSWSYNDSDQKTFKWMPAAEAYGGPDSLLSNTFGSAFKSNATGAGLVYRKENLTINGRISYQMAQLTSDQEFPDVFEIGRKFENILPTLSLRYRVRGGKSFTMSYRTNTDEPSVNQLQEVLNNDNPLHLSIGNAELEQEYSHRVSMRYSAPNPEKSTVFFALLSGSVTDRYLGRQIYFARRERTVEDGVTIPAGAQLTRPVNLDGYYNVRTFLTYGMPVNFLKSNLNINLSGSYGRTPGMINKRLNYSYSPSAGGGITFSSNISEKIDFTVSGHTDYNFVSNSLRNQADNDYFSNNLRARLYWDIWKGIIFTSRLTYHWYMGLSDSYNENYFLWNLSLGKRILNDKGEIRISAYDILKQNTNISRTIRAAFIQDTQTDILQQYFMLSFRYKIRNFERG